ncbi:MAG: BA14K family protein [Pseudomonadota bacterium]
MRIFLSSLLIAGSFTGIPQFAIAQPTDIGAQIQHCRFNGHRDKSCEYLCYELNVYEACQILQNRNNSGNNRNQIIGGIVAGVVSGIVAGAATRRNNATQQSNQQQPVAAQPAQSGGQLSNEHYAYCINKYKSYKVATNTYTSFSGKTKYCNSPYD